MAEEQNQDQDREIHPGAASDQPDLSNLPGRPFERPPVDGSAASSEGAPGVTSYVLDDKNTTTVRTTQIPDEPAGT
jgi:hypothetical protein